jgi:thioesterase domain-containing protein
MLCGVHIYARLGKSMARDRAVFGVYVELEERMLLDGSDDFSVPRIARAYIEEIRAVRPKGPYILGGVSFGGVIGFEVAQQLREMGEEVQLLILLDSILPRALQPRGWKAGLRRSARVTLDRIKARLADTAGNKVKRLLQAQGASPHHEASVQALSRIRDEAFGVAADQYDVRVRPYDGPSIVFRARRRVDDLGPQVAWDLGWAELLPHSTPVFGVDGDHLGILLKPGSREIAQILRRHLPAVQEPEEENTVTMRLPVFESNPPK